MTSMVRFFFVMLLAFSSAVVSAAEIAGRVIMARGDVNASNAAGERRLLKRRDPVYATDTITTGDQSRVQIRFIDKGMMALKENTTLNIKAYRQADGAGDDGQVLMELVEGGFRTLTGTIGKGNKAAYKVETPVASIGIRGTLYSILLQKNQLLAGVWKGGISVNSPQGSLQLGSGADFDFAAISNQGLQGLLTPPAALEPPPAATPDTEDTQASTEPESTAPDTETASPQAPEALAETTTDNDRPSLPTTELPNSFDKDQDSTREDTLRERLGSTDGGDQPTPIDGGDSGADGIFDQSPDARFSANDYELFLKSDDSGMLVSNDEVTNGSTFIDENGHPVFVSVQQDNPRAVDVSRYNGEITALSSPLANVSWGLWNGTSENPILRYSDSNSLDNRVLTSSALWLKAQPATDAQLSQISDSLGLGGTVGFYTESSTAPGIVNGVATTATISGGFDLSLTDGSISEGSLTADFGNDSWNISFSGTIRPGGSASNSSLAELQVNSGFHGEIAIDTSNSEIGGLLVAPASPGAMPGFAGGYRLTDEQNNTASGLIAIEGQAFSGEIISPQ